MHGDYYALLLHLFFSPFVFLLLCIWHFLTRWWADYCSQKSQVKAAITHAVKMPQWAASLADWFQPALCPSQIVPRCLCVTFCFLKQKNRLRRLHVPKSCGKSVQQVKKKTHRIACALKMKIYSCTRSVGALLRVNISMQKHSQFFTDQR